MFCVLTFVTENEHGHGRHGIQWQFPNFTMNCIAIDLSFARQIMNFVAETRANPIYRDTPLGGETYQHIPEKDIDLSPSFSDVEFKVHKLGEWDHGYSFYVSSRPEFWVSFELHDKELDDFLTGLREVADI